MTLSSRFGSLLACLSLLTAFAAPSADAAEYELNFTTPYFERQATVTSVFKPLIEKIAKDSKGEIEITYFAPNTINPEKENYNSVVSGSLDIGANVTSRNPGQFAAADIVQLPMINVSPRNAALSWWDLVQKYPDAFPEIKNIKLLGCWTGAMNAISTAKTPIRKLEDLKGMRIATISATNIDMLKQLGATPMQMSNADVYLALERGMIDGVITAIPPIRAQKLNDVVKYITIMNINCTPFWCGMNKGIYEEMSPELKKVIDDNTGRAFSEAVGKCLEDSAETDLKWIVEQGKTEAIILDDAERARWAEQLAPITEATIKKIVTAGFDESLVREMMGYYKERVEANKQ
ncbi:MAG: TRAP transporter substrate-binding protein DctP [Mailhella sp.]|nr:TRAP transporter substrate-binding protein DctP [Mailhella sp.]